MGNKRAEGSDSSRIYDAIYDLTTIEKRVTGEGVASLGPGCKVRIVISVQMAGE